MIRINDLPPKVKGDIRILADDFQEMMLPIETYCMAASGNHTIGEAIERLKPIRVNLDSALKDINATIAILEEYSSGDKE